MRDESQPMDFHMSARRFAWSGRRLSRFAVGALLAVSTLLGCSFGTGPEVVVPLNFSTSPLQIVIDGDTVTYTSEDPELIRSSLPRISADAGQGTIVIRGSLVDGCLNGPTRTIATRRSTTVSLTITTPDGPTCPDRSSAYSYEARLMYIPAGTHQVVVEHHGDILWGDGVVLEQQVQVP